MSKDEYKVGVELHKNSRELIELIEKTISLFEEIKKHREEEKEKMSELVDLFKKVISG